MILNKLIRPALATGSRFNPCKQALTTKLLISHVNRAPIMASGFNCKDIDDLYHHRLGTTRVMSTAASNYHYHEKPPAHKHDALWKAERYLSLVLLGVLPAAWVIPHPFMDYAVATSLVVHVHWGVEAIVTDYVRPSIFGTVIPKISIALVYVLSILTAGGLFLFNWTDVGITQAFKMLSTL